MWQGRVEGRGVGAGQGEGVQGGEVAAAGHRQLEAVDVEPLLQQSHLLTHVHTTPVLYRVGVGQEPHEVVFLEAAGGVVGVEVAAGGPRVHALLQPLGLGVTLVTGPETCTHWLHSDTVSPSEHHKV